MPFKAVIQLKDQQLNVGGREASAGGGHADTGRC